MQTRGRRISGGKRPTRIAETGFIDHPHLIATAPTDHEASEKRLALARCPTRPPGKGARIICQAGLVRQKLLPTDVGWIHTQMKAVPLFHRPLRTSPLPWTPLRVEGFTPIDKCPGVGGIMEHLAQGGRGRFAPTHLSGLSPSQLASRQYNAIITQAPQDLMTTAQRGEARKDELKRVLNLCVRVFNYLATFQSDQASWQGLTVGAALNLALAPRIHTETQDVEFGLAEQPA